MRLTSPVPGTTAKATAEAIPGMVADLLDQSCAVVAEAAGTARVRVPPTPHVPMPSPVAKRGPGRPPKGQRAAERDKHSKGTVVVGTDPTGSEAAMAVAGQQERDVAVAEGVVEGVVGQMEPTEDDLGHHDHATTMAPAKHATAIQTIRVVHARPFFDLHAYRATLLLDHLSGEFVLTPSDIEAIHEYAFFDDTITREHADHDLGADADTDTDTDTDSAVFARMQSHAKRIVRGLQTGDLTETLRAWSDVVTAAAQWSVGPLAKANRTTSMAFKTARSTKYTKSTDLAIRKTTATTNPRRRRVA